MNDPIVEEIRHHRERYAARFNFDVTAICRDLQERQATCGREVISRSPKKIAKGHPASIEASRVSPQ
jgi:hypothetical protein